MGKGKLLHVALKAQITIRMKVVGSKSKKIIFTKGTIEQLKQGVLQVIADPIEDDCHKEL